MSSFFQKIKVKKDNQFMTNSQKLIKAAEKKDTLPDDFFEQILACEIQLKKGFSMTTLRKLINLYSRAVEYYESINDPRYMRYSKSLQVLLLQPQIVKQINMQTKKGKIKVHKQERKKEILDEFKNLDKKFINNTDAKEIISKTNWDNEEFYFGTNEYIEVSTDDLLGCLKTAREINHEDYKVLDRLGLLSIGFGDNFNWNDILEHAEEYLEEDE